MLHILIGSDWPSDSKDRQVRQFTPKKWQMCNLLDQSWRLLRVKKVVNSKFETIILAPNRTAL